MSLLMDALTRAEKAKKQAEAGKDSATAPVVAAQESFTELEIVPHVIDTAEKSAVDGPLPEAPAGQGAGDGAIVFDLDIAAEKEAPAGVPEPAVAAVEPATRPASSGLDPEPQLRPVTPSSFTARADGGDSPLRARTVFLAKKQFGGRSAFRSQALLTAAGILLFFGVAAVSYLGYRIYAAKPAGFLAIPVGPPALPMPPETPGPAELVAEGEQSEPALPVPEVASQPAENPASRRNQFAEEAERPALTPPAPDAGANAPRHAQLPVAEAAPINPIVITRRKATAALDPSLAEAYAAYRCGDLGRANRVYLQVLQSDPLQRNALLGLAAIAYHRGDTEVALTYYRRLLERDPGDPMARAGMLAMTPVSDISRPVSELKLLLAQYPETAALHFGLGNLYAAQKNWPEAQHSYAAAFAYERKSAGGAGILAPDYAFNLAVSLEHLGRNREALQHYKEALDLAGHQLPVAFDRTLAMERIAMLELLRESSAP